MSDLIVKREEQGSHASVFIAREGTRVAEMTFSRLGPQQWRIDHTEVDGSLRGQGAGRKLLDFAVAWARENDATFVPQCPYAKAQFDKDASLRDVLAT